MYVLLSKYHPSISLLGKLTLELLAQQIICVEVESLFPQIISAALQ